MKILISVASLSKGSGLSQYVLTLSKILRKNIQDVTIITTHEKTINNNIKKNILNISPNIKYINIFATRKIIKYLSIIKQILKIKPDIIINNYNGLIQYILPFLPKSIKIIHVLHNDTDDFYRIGSINAHRVTLWIAPTQGIADNFNKYTNSKYKDKVRVISHGVDDPLSLRTLKSKDTPVEILFTGVLYEHKGVKELPFVIKELKKRKLNFHFTIIGTGILEKWLKKEFDAEIKEGIVEFTGVLDHKEVYKRMSEADIFYYPTHLDAFGLVIAEAMINGAVPVVTHINGVTDNLISNGETGFLLPQGDTQRFADIIERLINDDKLLETISKNTKVCAHKNFSIEIMKNNYQKLLKNL